MTSASRRVFDDVTAVFSLGLRAMKSCEARIGMADLRRRSVDEERADDSRFAVGLDSRSPGGASLACFFSGSARMGVRIFGT